ncbi:hypothetical protein V1508DRAFT_462410, partial [Lipomyces doorenjongii]|uniref:uncharacterized protein n=1 Tax=Lipomyces doorenjongii TaxID=383834 RepID=UPI0034CDD286
MLSTAPSCDMLFNSLLSCPFVTYRCKPDNKYNLYICWSQQVTVFVRNVLETMGLGSMCGTEHYMCEFAEDLLRDNVLEEKVRIWSWIEVYHLDVEKSIIDSGERFILLAEDELLKINNYRAPRDKIICILNCCKVIFGLLRQTKTEESADKFLPILVYVVIKAQPRHLVSNVQYIMRFRSPDKLNGEAGYYLSSLQGAISFIESLDRNALNITDEEFEERVVQSVAMIQEKADRRDAHNDLPSSPRTSTSATGLQARTQTPPSRPFSPADMADVASGVASQ